MSENVLSFDVISPNVTASLHKRGVVKMKFENHADAEQFIILLGEAARMKAKLSMHLGPARGETEADNG